MEAPSTGRSTVLRQRDALHTTPAYACGLELDVESSEIRVRREPAGGRGSDATGLLLVDHLERVPEAGAALLLHLDDEDAATAAQHEIELVPPHPNVRGQEPVSAESVVTEGDSLAPVHAALVTQRAGQAASAA
jgi:hypothetical protein